MNTGQLETVAVWIEAAERAPAREQGAGAVEAGIASLREIHHYMDGDVSGAVEAGRRSVEQGDTPGGPWVARCSHRPLLERPGRPGGA